MSSPYTRLRTEDEELMHDAGMMDSRDNIIKLISERICFDNKAGSCPHLVCYNNAELVEIIRKEYNG